MLTLYNYWSSTCSQKVRLCLHEKDLVFENRHINLFEFEHWSPDYSRVNPKGVVPALDHNGNVNFWAICLLACQTSALSKHAPN
jgi:glutathione S-transferase